MLNCVRVCHSKSQMYFEQMWGRFPVVAGDTRWVVQISHLCGAMYFYLWVWFRFTWVKAKTPFNFHRHWTADTRQLMMGTVSFWKQNQPIDVLCCKAQTWIILLPLYSYSAWLLCGLHAFPCCPHCCWHFTTRIRIMHFVRCCWKIDRPLDKKQHYF